MAQLPPSLPHKKEVSMTSKRSNGEGTIYKNESRNRFEGQFSDDAMAHVMYGT